MNDSIRVLVTGRLWVGARGARTTGSVLFDMMADTHQELIVVAYRFTIAMRELRKSFEGVLGRGCLVKLIIDSSNGIHAAEAKYLDNLLRNYPNFELWDFLDKDSEGRGAQLHAKVVISDRRMAVVGSANLSKNGLVANHELGLQITGRPVTGICYAIDQMLEDGQKTGVLRRRKVP